MTPATAGSFFFSHVFPRPTITTYHKILE
jgi:hypothetical protein